MQEGERGKWFNLEVRKRLCVEAATQRQWKRYVSEKQNRDRNAEVEGRGKVGFRIALQGVQKEFFLLL